MVGGVNHMASRSVSVFVVTIIFFAIATLFVGFRMLSRAWIVKRVSVDDYFMLVAWVIAFGLAFSICYGATVGLGRHESDVPDSWQSSLRTSQYAFSVLYQPALMMQKTSILVFYLSLSQSNKIFRWAVIATLVVVDCIGFALTMFTAFQCSPPSAAYAWPRPQDAQCQDVVTIYLSSSPVNIITDLAILLLPMPILTRMRLPKKQKWILVITFSFGVFVAVVDVIRVAYLQDASTARLNEIATMSGGRSAEDDLNDFSWYASQSFMWTAIEVNVGIMCACVPGLKPLVTRFAPHFIHDDSQTNLASSNNIAQMNEAHHVPTFQDADVTHRDFAPPSPVSPHRQSFRPQPLHPDADMDMIDFLTVPGMPQPSSPTVDERGRAPTRTDSVLTTATRGTRQRSPTFFDFVEGNGKKSMVHMTNRDSIFPVSMVTILFFIWGFEYGLLDVLNQQFQTVARMSQGKAVAMHSAYFAGYAIGPLTVGRLVLKNWGFKACYNVGLAIYACGSLIFWVAAVLTSFPAYVIVNLIVGVGLSVLETGANPFIALCGPQEYAEIRLNLSQGVQAIGTIVAPLIAAKGFTKYTDNAPSLINTQWAYLGIALFTIAVAFAYFYVPLPGATDAELEDASERIDHAHYATVRLAGRPTAKGIRITWVILGLGIMSMFCYLGGQEVLATGFGSYLSLVQPGTDRINAFAVGHTLFAVSRFIAAGLGFWFRPRNILLAFYCLAILFSALASASTLTPDAGFATALMVFFAEGPLFPMIFAQSLRGQGRYTKDAAALLTSAIGGGGVFPVFSYLASRAVDARYAMVVAIATFVCGALFPFALCLWPAARKVVDPIWHPANSTSDGGRAGDGNLSAAREEKASERPLDRSDGGSGDHSKDEGDTRTSLASNTSVPGLGLDGAAGAGTEPVKVSIPVAERE